MLYSIVIPVYNSASMIHELYQRIKQVFENDIREDFEIILVDDSSRDGSLAEIRKISAADQRVKYILLAKNHGQQKAVMCGIEHSSGDYVITMDDDLQHPPEEIPKLIAKIKSDAGLDVVIGMYDSKKHSGIRKLGTKLLDILSNVIFKKEKALKLTSFRIMKSFVADNLSEVNLKSPTVGHCLLMIDDNIANTLVRHEPRTVGKSGYNFLGLVKTFMGNVYVNSDLPLRIVGHIGTISALGSLILGIYYLIRYLTGHVGVSGWTTLVMIVLFMNGLLLFSVGIIGRYLMVNINEAKRLPKYSIKEKNVDQTRGT